LGAELGGSVQQLIRAATFEVVQLKPPDGEVTYERELPLDLIPYQERTDKYRSIGTAFAIGPNRYVTAGHVIDLGLGSQFGPPALRDGAGKVYDIEQVLKFSDRRDFVVFSLREPPKGAKFLTPGGKPALNETVYAVGNALGQGVIIRNGVYTSDTPEELDGQWKWLRFSAAASPGNSGGPLVDERGRAIGVVLRKSPAENLNTALPIAELMNAKDGEGRISGRIPMRLGIIDASETAKFDERFDLPKPLAQFYTTMLELTVRLITGAQQKLLEHNAAHLFPRGAGSEQLLHTIDRAAFPRLMREDPNKVWVATSPQAQTVQLDRNGFVEQAAGLVRLRVPDGVSLATLYGDDKLYMDLLLKAHVQRRTVGSDSVRVTSLGKPKASSHFTDRWGRTWQVRDWAIPYDDQILTVASLPTPEGYVGFLAAIASGFVDVTHKTQQLVCDYADVTMMGTLAQWQDYLAQPGVQPKAFDTLRIRIDPAQEVQFHAARFELTVKPELIKLSKDSMLFLDFGFSGSADAARWDVERVMVSERLHTNNWIDVARRTEPPASLPDSFQTNWNKLKTQGFPFNGRIESENGQTRIKAAVQPPGS
ncbi:MAG TPA: serine protease, partial [Burkholderiaceae bacterium]|nr:serine protease [Burkholderiaceae bacterium]